METANERPLTLGHINQRRYKAHVTLQDGRRHQFQYAHLGADDSAFLEFLDEHRKVLHSFARADIRRMHFGDLE